MLILRLSKTEELIKYQQIHKKGLTQYLEQQREKNKNIQESVKELQEREIQLTKEDSHCIETQKDLEQIQDIYQASSQENFDLVKQYSELTAEIEELGKQDTNTEKLSTDEDYLLQHEEKLFHHVTSRSKNLSKYGRKQP